MAAPPTFFARLTARARAVDSLVCVGLDPHPGDLPADTADAGLAACLRLVELTAAHACCFKPNAAFFERWGAAGFEALRALIAAVPDDVPVLLDAKRGDIASTAEAYAVAAFDGLGADAVTVSPYLGGDSVAPFAAREDRGVFVLCKTSNPGADDLQALFVAPAADDPGPPRRLYEHVADLARGWNARDNVGVVVGATDPAALAAVRARAPELWILAPGVGAQGGDLEAAVAAGLRADGLGLIIPASRAIARAADPAAATDGLRVRINAARAKQGQGKAPVPVPEPVPVPPTSSLLETSRFTTEVTESTEGSVVAVPSLVEEEAKTRSDSTPDPLAALADGLLDAGCVRFGRFTLKSGLESPVYLDLRRLVAAPALMRRVAAAYVDLLAGLTFDHVAALPYAALPIGTAVALAGGHSLVYPRREAKDYGTRVAVEGVFAEGDRVVVLDDLATTGGSKFEALERLAAAGLVARDVVVLIDRESGARAALEAAGLAFHAVFTLSDLVARWRASGRVDDAQADAVLAFIAAGQPGSVGG